jgi:hypothetical protein
MKKNAVLKVLVMSGISLGIGLLGLMQHSQPTSSLSRIALAVRVQSEIIQKSLQNGDSTESICGQVSSIHQNTLALYGFKLVGAPEPIAAKIGELMNLSSSLSMICPTEGTPAKDLGGISAAELEKRLVSMASVAGELSVALDKIKKPSSSEDTSFPTPVPNAPIPTPTSIAE